MEKKIKWNKAALKQLDNIYEFIKKDSIKDANKVEEKILQKIEQLPSNPTIYSPDRYKRNNINNSYRAFTVYRFRISYYVKKSEIIIIRIRHTSMSPLMY